MAITGTIVSDKVRQWAAQVINSATSLVTSFSVNGYAVNPSELPKVADALRTGRIWLGYLPDGTDFHAGYVSGGYMLIDRRANKQKLVLTQSKLIHEAIHAAFDLRGGTSPFEIGSFIDEACAYTAEAMYLRRQGVLPSEVIDHKPLAIGWRAAASTQSAGNVSKFIINEFNAVLAEYGYLKTSRRKAGFDQH